MKRLCYASLLKVLYHCKPYNVSQCSINGTMLLILDEPEYLTGDDNAASTMSTGQRNVSPEAGEKVRNIKVASVVNHFRGNVINLLNKAKIKTAILALIDILAEDDSIPGDTPIYVESFKTKNEIINETEFDPAELIANLFLYAVANVKSSELKTEIREVTPEYLNSFELKKDRIFFIKTNEESLPLLSAQTDNNIQLTRVENIIISNSTSRKYLSDTIDEDFDDFFVETTIYKQVTACLEEKNIVILIGQPGMGKTITSKKVANDYKLKGYKILYSDERNIANTKDVLNEINPQDKILIVLNDFLGQFYTDLKVDEKSEMRGLIAFIKQYRNIKLLINTRGIIYREAMQHEKFSDAIDDNWKLIHEIQIGELDINDKALILINHLKRAYKDGHLLKEHYLNILKDSIFVQIINHKNFNPRIIEYLTHKKRLDKIEPMDYVNRIFKVLGHPEEIWQKEYEELDELDRICLNTLFSLTNTNVPILVLQECFDERQKHLDKDSTINYFEKSVKRLTDSFVSVIRCNGEQRIGIINPSLNDFLFGNLMKNQIEMDKILENSLYYEQIDKLMSCKSKKTKLIEQINKGLFGRLNTFPKKVFSDFEMYAESSHHLYILKILLIYLDKSDLARCGLGKEDIQNYIEGIFKNHYERIEADVRLYHAYELPDVFVELLKNTNAYDLTEIIATQKYFDVILNSIVRHENFWRVLRDIQEKYFCLTDEEFYNLDNIKLCIIEKITSESITDNYDDVLDRICSEIEDNYDEFESYDYYDDITDCVLNSVEDDIYELIVDSISNKLGKYSIDSINEDDFDIYTIISDDINVAEMIEQEYDKITYFKSDDFKENIEKSGKNIIELFEDASWIKLDE